MGQNADFHPILKFSIAATRRIQPRAMQFPAAQYEPGFPTGSEPGTGRGCRKGPMLPVGKKIALRNAGCELVRTGAGVGGVNDSRATEAVRKPVEREIHNRCRKQSQRLAENQTAYNGDS